MDSKCDLTLASDDSFLELERQCELEEEQQKRMLDAAADRTMLFDIEPPSELWDQSIVETAQLEQIHEEETPELSPVKMVHLLRPSTIIEETSSQCNSTQSTMEKEESLTSFSSSDTSVNSTIERPFGKRNSNNLSMAKSQANRRETMMFKKRKFFNDENDEPELRSMKFAPPKLSISPEKVLANSKCEESANEITTDQELIRFDESVMETPDRDQFNDTIEEMDFFMAKGKKLLEQTPIGKRSANFSVLETPLFSCKRSRIISEMAALEMFPPPKRGPLLDLFSSPDERANSTKRPNHQT